MEKGASGMIVITSELFDRHRSRFKTVHRRTNKAQEVERLNLEQLLHITTVIVLAGVSLCREEQSSKPSLFVRLGHPEG